jgi:hypothetical protein
MATMLCGPPALATASRAVASVVVQISSGSCSTQPERGKCCMNSRCAMLATRQLSSKISARDDVVPWSIAST